MEQNRKLTRETKKMYRQWPYRSRPASLWNVSTNQGRRYWRSFYVVLCLHYLAYRPLVCSTCGDDGQEMYMDARKNSFSRWYSLPVAFEQHGGHRSKLWKASFLAVPLCQELFSALDNEGGSSVWSFLIRRRKKIYRTHSMGVHR